MSAVNVLQSLKLTWLKLLWVIARGPAALILLGANAGDPFASWCPTVGTGKRANSVSSCGGWIFWALNDRFEKYAGCRLANLHSMLGSSSEYSYPTEELQQGYGLPITDLATHPVSTSFFMETRKINIFAPEVQIPRFYTFFEVQKIQDTQFAVLISSRAGYRRLTVPHTHCQPLDSTQPVPCHEGTKCE